MNTRPLPRRIFVAGHRGMVGKALCRALAGRADTAVLTANRATLDLTDQAATRAFMHDMRPDAVLLAAARVGGIGAHGTDPAGMIRDNLMIAAHVIHAAYEAGVTDLVQLGSSAAYPPTAPQPLHEDALLSAPPDPGHMAYALAKIAAIKMCDAYNAQYGVRYRSLLPTNLYGPGDNFHAGSSHVLAALLRRFHEAAVAGSPVVTIWGTGTPRREFLHVDDLARAMLHVLEMPTTAYDAHVPRAQGHVNVGTGQDIAIGDLAQMIAGITGFAGRIETDPTKPDGTMRKRMDVSRMAGMGWRASIGLAEGLDETYRWFLAHQDALRV